MGCDMKLLMMMFLSVLLLDAKIIVEGNSVFVSKVHHNLQEAKAHSVYLHQLINRIEASSQRLLIHAITDDRSTWHRSGEKSRSHTEILGQKKRGTFKDAVVYINVNRITVKHKSYRSGVLMHELVHGFDDLYGLDNRDYSIRERRAVFFQNVWRTQHGKKPRHSYHKRFATLDYQSAKKAGLLDHYVQYMLHHNNLP